ncbi:MAG: hypothetical protein JRJ66_10615 [Deltaproteobacteria bacterium]|nr:hypothetical protein [Deltaproteobacteria bacterium]MBW2045467.1 hypothetical protein [Deltaproteobacteria bacterium]
MLAKEGTRVQEDDLTHAVLGLFRYLPPQLWLQDFINELRRRNQAALSTLEIWSHAKVSLWPSYLIPEDWRRAFWRPKARRGKTENPKSTICPDALIETDRWLMFVESEYSHDLDSEQMFQQFAIAGLESQGKDFFVLLINKALTRPSHCGVYSERLSKSGVDIQPDNSLEEFISRSCSLSLGFPFSEDGVKKRLLWINWQSIQSILADLAFERYALFTLLPAPFQAMIRLMRDDVCNLLENQGLIPIGFDVTQDLAELCTCQNAIPYLPVVKPPVQLLTQLEVRSEDVPKWHSFLGIQGILGTAKLWLDCLPEPFFQTRGCRHGK